jgi:hypothetical protein
LLTQDRVRPQGHALGGLANRDEMTRPRGRVGLKEIRHTGLSRHRLEGGLIN